VPGELVARALREFGVTIDDAARPSDAQSGAGVYRVRTLGGAAAYLKVTPVALGPSALAAAQRELGFYRQLADDMPVRTPRMLDALDADLGVAMLLAAAGEQVQVDRWRGAAWSALGQDLAALHGVQVAPRSWARPDALLTAMSGPVPSSITAFWSGILPGLSDLLDARDELRAELAAQPAVLVHGDCHTGNIVHGPDGLVFCDWQSVGAGRATCDLAMVSVRAAPAGVAVPSSAMTAYMDRRGGAFSGLERALVLEELAIFVFLWPPYAAYNSQTGIAHVQARARDLAARWRAMMPPPASAL
jgi:aminoglycoside phosphotransferase (APT) family kinase protein